jgi:hypothetical protein
MKISKFSRIYRLIWLIGVISMLIYFAINYFSYQDDLEKIATKKINGIMIESRDINRGFCYIVINDNISKSKLSYQFHCSHFFLINSIQPGDSVSKEPNSKIMIFYKKSHNTYIKCCEYNINM